MKPRYLALSSLTATALAAGVFAAGPASANSGTPAGDTPDFCPSTGVQTLPDGSLQFGVEANGAGCVVVRASGGDVSLSDVILAPGWTDEVKRADGRVEVRFADIATRDKTEVRVEDGRTEVK